MGLVAKSSSEKRDPVPAGKYLSVCVGIFDIGTQPSEKYGPSPYVVFQFELWTKEKKSGKLKCLLDDRSMPHLLSSKMGVALGRNRANKQVSRLRMLIDGMTGQSMTDDQARDGVNMKELLEVQNRMTVDHIPGDDGATYDNIKVITECDEADPEISPLTESIYFDMDESGNPPDGTPEWIKKLIMRSIEWGEKHGGGASKTKKAVAVQDDDEIPF